LRDEDQKRQKRRGSTVIIPGIQGKKMRLGRNVDIELLSTKMDTKTGNKRG